MGVMDLKRALLFAVVALAIVIVVLDAPLRRLSWFQRDIEEVSADASVYQVR